MKNTTTATTNNLTVYNHSGTLVTDSRDVAVMVDKRHANLLRDIDVYIEHLTKSTELKIEFSDFFIANTYQDATGRILPCYLITKKGCDMIANKMTGEKGILFTAAYIDRFYTMEEQIKTKTISSADRVKLDIRLKRAEAMLVNAQARWLGVITKMLPCAHLSEVAAQSFTLKALETVTGIDIGDLLPAVEKTYSATEVGAIQGVSANKVGIIANAHNIKTDENGIVVIDKSRYSQKQVESFRYNQCGVDAVGRALGLVD